MKYCVNRVAYVPGKYISLADALSHTYVGNADGELEVYTVQVCDEKAALIEAYRNDNLLNKLHKTIVEGWNWKAVSLAAIELYLC